MREERLGSYSIEATLPGTPYLSRLKSIRRSFCLWPPPWCLMVKSPELRRPPVRCLTASSGLCGRLVVMSSFTRVVWKRSGGVIGLYVLIGIVSLVLPSKTSKTVSVTGYHALHRVDVVGHLLALLQANVSLLPVGAETGELAPATLLAQEIGGTHAPYLHLEQRLDRLLDLGLGCVRSHVKNQRALHFLDAQALFRNEGALDHVIKSRHQATSEPAASLRREQVFFNDSCNCSIAAREKMARS